MMNGIKYDSCSRTVRAIILHTSGKVKPWRVESGVIGKNARVFLLVFAFLFLFFFLREAFTVTI